MSDGDAIQQLARERNALTLVRACHDSGLGAIVLQPSRVASLHTIS